MPNSLVDVAVIGAGGPTGRSLIAALAERFVTTRALLHKKASAGLFAANVETATVELSDAKSLISGIRGARIIHYIPPTYNAAEEQYGANVIAAAMATGVERLVYHSVLHAPTPSMPHHWRKSRVELAIRESPLAWTIVQPAMYMQTSYAFLSPDRTRLTPGFDVARLFTPVDLQDLSVAAARILTADGHEYATYELAGGERTTFEGFAAALADVLGHAVTAEALDPELLVAQAMRTGFSAEAASELRLMMAHYEEHGLLGNGNVLAMILGRPPTSYAAAIRRDFGTRHEIG